MENLGLIGAVGIGVSAVLAAPVLVWAFVVTGLRQVAKKESPQRAAKPGVRSGRVDA